MLNGLLLLALGGGGKCTFLFLFGLSYHLHLNEDIKRGTRIPNLPNPPPISWAGFHFLSLFSFNANLAILLASLCSQSSDACQLHSARIGVLDYSPRQRFKWSLCLIVTETVLLSASPTAATISCVIETILHIYRSRASVQRALHMLSPTASRQSYKVGSEVQCDGKAMYRAVAQKLPPVQPKRQAKKGNAGGFAN